MSANLSESLSSLIQSTNLLEISLKSANVEAKVPSKAVVPKEIKLDYTKSTEFLLTEDNKILVCFVTLVTKGLSNTEQTEKVIFEMSGTFTLIYALEEQAEFDSEVFKLFTEKNAFYNAYPYLRELMQSLSSRIGIQPIVLPLLKPTTKTELQREVLEKDTVASHKNT